jgi:hypothetical protein
MSSLPERLIVQPMATLDSFPGSAGVRELEFIPEVCVRVAAPSVEIILYFWVPKLSVSP